MPKFVQNWRTAWGIPIFREQFLTSIIALLVALVAIRLFLDFIETRPGVVLHDPILSFLPAVDLRLIAFSLVYSGMLLGFISLSLYPFSFLLAMRACVVLILARIVCLSLLPLDPPAGIIPFADPFIQLPDVRPVYTRDLFFSWHIALLSLFVYTARWRDMKLIFAAGALVISILLLLQHVEYTIDIVAAPCFAYMAYGVAKRLTIREAAAGPARRQAERADGHRP